MRSFIEKATARIMHSSAGSLHGLLVWPCHPLHKCYSTVGPASPLQLVPILVPTHCNRWEWHSLVLLCPLGHVCFPSRSGYTWSALPSCKQLCAFGIKHCFVSSSLCHCAARECGVQHSLIMDMVHGFVNERLRGNGSMDTGLTMSQLIKGQL